MFCGESAGSGSQICVSPGLERPSDTAGKQQPRQPIASIYSTGDENPAGVPLERSVTCLSIIMNLSCNQIHYNLGNPCEGDSIIL